MPDLSGRVQVQASAWSRWRFGDKQAKPSEVQTSGAEIFIMLPLGIIAVGELSEGEEVSFIHQCAAPVYGLITAVCQQRAPHHTTRSCITDARASPT